MELKERTEGDVLVIELEGDADLATVPALQEQMRAKMKDNLPHVIMDFSGVDFVNTPVWAVVVEYYQHANKAGSKLSVSGLKDRVEASFNIVRLGEFIPNFPTVQEALQG